MGLERNIRSFNFIRYKSKLIIKSKLNNMTWNYRILAHKENKNWFFQIHEVYYNKKGKPTGYTENAVEIMSESVEGISWQLEQMTECLNKPILSAKNFPKKHKSKN